MYPSKKGPKLFPPPPSKLRFEKVELGARLETVLGTDFLLARQNTFHKMPAKFSIKTIVEDYCNNPPTHMEGAPITSVERDKLLVVAKAMIDYTDVMLEPKLLYRDEKVQFNEYKENSGDLKFRPSSHYGFVHLIRLVVNFPTFIIQPDWKQLDLENNQRGIEYFVKFLATHCDKYYQGAEDYEGITMERFASKVDEWSRVKR